MPASPSPDPDPRPPVEPGPAPPCPPSPAPVSLPARRARPRFVFPTGPLIVGAWSDPLLDRHGHDPRSDYAERFWLPILGPSALMVLRRLVTALDTADATHTSDTTGTTREGDDDLCVIEVRALASSIGMGGKQGPSAPFFRTMERVISFGFAQLLGVTTLMVRTHLPSLTRRQLNRLPMALRLEHDALVPDPPPTAIDPVQMRRRARALALSLVELGEDHDATERQLHRWRFHPAIAHDAVRWATTEHETRRQRRLEQWGGDAA